MFNIIEQVSVWAKARMPVDRNAVAMKIDCKVFGCFGGSQWMKNTPKQTNTTMVCAVKRKAELCEESCTMVPLRFIRKTRAKTRVASTAAR
jgi:hypothetical protein